MYITCYLLATSTSQAIDDEHRACSYVGGWDHVLIFMQTVTTTELENYLHLSFPFADGRRSVELMQLVPPVSLAILWSIPSHQLHLVPQPLLVQEQQLLHHLLQLLGNTLLILLIQGKPVMRTNLNVCPIKVFFLHDIFYSQKIATFVYYLQHPPYSLLSFSFRSSRMGRSSHSGSHSHCGEEELKGDRLT